MNTLIIGLQRAWHYRPLLLIAFLTNLLTAVPLALLPAYGLLQAADYPVLREAADGVDLWLALETLLSPSARAITGFTLLSLAFIPLVAWLMAAFLKGGILLIYAEAPAAFNRRRFLWGCWHWFGAFLAQGLLQFLAFFFLWLPAAILIIFLASAAGRWLVWFLTPLLLFLFLFWLVWLEYTAYLAVTRQRRNLFKLFAQALGLLLRRPLPIARLYLPALLLLVLLHVIYRWGVRPLLPLNWWPLVLIVQQAFIFTRLFARLGRWAAGMELVRSNDFSRPSH